MCWSSKYVKRLIADKDIKCWKIIRQYEDNHVYSLYLRMKYLLNKEYSLGRSIYVRQVNKSSFLNVKYEINQGFHSYFNKPKLILLNDEFNVEVNGMIVDRIYYNPSAISTRDIHIAECIIPKGSVYYMNDSHEVVSDKIIIKNVLV